MKKTASSSKAKKTTGRKAGASKKIVVPSGEKMPIMQFVETAIKTLREPNYTGIHVVYSGFNKAFRDYYGTDPRPHVDALAAEGKLVVVIVRGGVMINLASEFKGRPPKNNVLAKILAGA